MITDQRQITSAEWSILAAAWLLSDNTKQAYNMLHVQQTTGSHDMALTYNKQLNDAMITATRCNPKWGNHIKAAFHAFNPNGVLAHRTASDDRIRSLVDSGFAKSGALLAHGSLNDYHVRKLYDCAMKSRVSSFDINYYVERIEHEIAAADDFINRIAACI